MTKIKITEYGECAVKNCPFNKTCAQHQTAGDFRSESGFKPEISKKGDSFYCSTINRVKDEEQTHGAYPVNYSELGMGFRNLKELNNLSELKTRKADPEGLIQELRDKANSVYFDSRLDCDTIEYAKQLLTKYGYKYD